MTTITSLLLDRIALSPPDRVALRVKRNGEYVPLTWSEVARDVWQTAAALHRLGVDHGKNVVHVAENRYEWLVTDLALLLLGAVHVPVHATLSGPQIGFQVRDCHPCLGIVSGQALAATFAGEELPQVEFLSYDSCDVPLAGRKPRLLAHVVHPDDAKRGRRLHEDRRKTVRPDDLATILYTSGTTGDPKGVMLTHKNLASNAVAALTAFGHQEGDVRLGWLPLSHIFARTCDLYTWSAAEHVELALGEGRDTVVGDMQATKPTLINGVPYFYERIMRVLVEQKLDTAENLRALFGGRIRMCCSGGAALPDHVARFYNERGVTLVQGYGLTETSPVISVNTDPAKVGSVGRAVPGVEVKIADDGEILTRGPHVMIGYRNLPDATAQTIKDGWLYTGDLGRLDEEGYLYITGRKKELIVTSGGKNIAPVILESLLTRDPLIQQAMVVGDGRSYLAALIVVDNEQLEAELSSRGLSIPQAARLADPRVRAIYEERIKRQLAGVSHYEQVAKFHLLAEPFSVERGELTPSLKMRRSVIGQHYAGQIAAMYYVPPGREVPGPA
jgi:long-chain acyl-CoA synthetase